MRWLLIFICSVVLMDCNPRETPTIHQSIDAGSGGDAVGHNAVKQEGHAETSDDGAPIEPTIEQVEAMINAEEASRLPHTDEERAIVAFVEKHVDREGLPWLAEPRKYLIEKADDHWVVTVLNLESIRRLQRGHDLEVHVRKTHGRLMVVDEVIR